MDIYYGAIQLLSLNLTDYPFKLIATRADTTRVSFRSSKYIFSVSYAPSPVSTLPLTSPHAPGPLPPLNISHSCENLTNLVQLVSLLSNNICSRGALAQNYLITISKSVHSFSQKLPKQASSCCTSSFSRRINLVVHGIKHYISLVGAITRIFPRFPEFC